MCTGQSAWIWKTSLSAMASASEAQRNPRFFGVWRQGQSAKDGSSSYAGFDRDIALVRKNGCSAGGQLQSWRKHQGLDPKFQRLMKHQNCSARDGSNNVWPITIQRPSAQTRNNTATKQGGRKALFIIIIYYNHNE